MGFAGCSPGVDMMADSADVVGDRLTKQGNGKIFTCNSHERCVCRGAMNLVERSWVDSNPCFLAQRSGGAGMGASFDVFR